jgi:hypothetical protein
MIPLSKIRQALKRQILHLFIHMQNLDLNNNNKKKKT